MIDIDNCSIDTEPFKSEFNTSDHLLGNIYSGTGPAQSAHLVKTLSIDPNNLFLDGAYTNSKTIKASSEQLIPQITITHVTIPDDVLVPQTPSLIETSQAFSSQLVPSEISLATPVEKETDIIEPLYIVEERVLHAQCIRNLKRFNQINLGTNSLGTFATSNI